MTFREKDLEILKKYLKSCDDGRVEWLSENLDIDKNSLWLFKNMEDVLLNDETITKLFNWFKFQINKPGYIEKYLEERKSLQSESKANCEEIFKLCNELSIDDQNKVLSFIKALT